MRQFFGGLFRLLATVGVCLGMLMVIYIGHSIFGESNMTPSYLFVGLLCVTLPCVLYHLLHDALNIGILDNIVGKVIKVGMFFALWAAMLFVQGISCDPSQLQYNGEGFIAEIMCYSSVVAGNVATLIYAMAIKNEQEEGLYFIPLYAMGASLVVGVVGTILGAVIPNFMDFGLWLAFVLSALAVVGYMLWKGVPFTETEGIFNRGGGRSYGYSSGGYRNNYNNNYNNNYDDYGDDDYGSSGADERENCYNPRQKLQDKMSDVCSYARGDCYATAYVTVNLSAYAKVSGSTIHFYISGNYKLHNVQNEYQLGIAKDDVQYGIEQFARNLNEGAKEAITRLRESYYNFDGAYDFEPHVSDLSNYT